MKLASLQPSVTVAKGKISFATMSHGCKGYFSHENKKQNNSKQRTETNNKISGDAEAKKKYLPANCVI